MSFARLLAASRFMQFVGPLPATAEMAGLTAVSNRSR